ncbi:MAG TPA: alpha/beta fold hydrolase [Kofleriaceae bacterium]|nr:alpha/beta fold hydrolase [Kofleriaceae bacterium]
MERSTQTGLPGFPFAPRWFTQSHGAVQHYLDEGSGPVVLMVHGNPTWSYYYRDLIHALRDTHRCVVPDHIGMGWSDKPDDAHYDHSVQQRVDDLDALVASLGLGDRITMVVHDWGGMIGFAWACRHPDRIARLVVLNSGPFPIPDDKKVPFLLRVARTRLVGSLLVRRANAVAKGVTKQGVERALAPEVRKAYLAPYDSPDHRRAIHRFVQDIAVSPDHPGYALARETGDALAQFATRPALIGWGMADFVFDDKFLREFRRVLPQAEVHEYADAGHLVLEDARERLIPAIAEFLARTA